MNKKTQNQLMDIRDLRDGGFLWIDKAALELVSEKIGNSGLAVYVWLCYYANAKSQDCYPSITTLSHRCHVTRRMIMYTIKKLEKLKLIAIEREPGKLNTYRLLDVPTGASHFTSETTDTRVVSPISPVLVKPQTHEQELIKQELLNKTEAIASVFSKSVDNLPYPPPNPEDIKRLKELCTELLPTIDLAKFIKVYAKDKGYPPPVEVMIKLCAQFKQDRSSIKNPWGWFRTTVKMESAKFFADLNVKEHQQYKENRTQCVNV